MNSSPLSAMTQRPGLPFRAHKNRNARCGSAGAGIHVSGQGPLCVQLQI
jgi:hypothetical protein